MTLVLAGAFLLVIGRIATLTIRDAEALTQRGVSQWTKAGTVTARRGSILDCHGNLLAISATAYTVTADPRLVTDIPAFLKALEPILPLDEEVAIKKLSDNTKGSVILKRQVTRETVDLLRTLKQEAPEKACLTALSFDEDVSRWYPQNTLLSQVLGLTTIDSEGQSGLESQYEDVLSGTPGSYLRQVDARNRTWPVRRVGTFPHRRGAASSSPSTRPSSKSSKRRCVNVWRSIWQHLSHALCRMCARAAFWPCASSRITIPMSRPAEM